MRSGIDLQHIDPAVRPQDDLFGHVNGRWMAETPIPDDRPADGAFYELRDAAEAHVRALIEAAAARAEPGSVAAKVGALFASFMDEEGIEARGRAPLAGDLAAVAAIRSTDQLVAEMARLQLDGAVGGLVVPYVNTDARDSAHYIVYLEQHGLGLPDESYYHQESFAPIREAYRGHVARMLVLGGWSPDEGAAQAAAHRVMALETAVAGYHWSAVETRDAVKSYNRRAVSELARLAPTTSVLDWLLATGAPAEHVQEVVVRQPSFLAAVPGLLAEQPIEAWRDWLAWGVIRSAAALLDREIVQANFSFYGTTLSGIPVLRERWKRGVSLVEGSLGEAVGELYVAAHFPPEAKGRMLSLVANLVSAYRERLEALPWMGQETRQRAVAKLDAFTPKIGYPDRWRSYDGLEIDAADLVGNVRRAAHHEAAREWGKLGQPVDRLEWFMTPQTVNAYYNPGMNEIVFPAAILQPPFFDMEADDAANYGAIGAVIGHEIGHGFDDQGSRFDGQGNLVDWWTEEDRARFDELAARLIAQYNGFQPRDLPEGNTVNGALTVGENIGDLGGVAVAYEAYRLSLAGAAAPTLDGLTGDQRFFLGWAQAWRANVREAEAIRRLTIDPHSPPEFRCNVVSNLDAFHEAFGVQAGDGMWRDPEDRIIIW